MHLNTVSNDLNNLAVLFDMDGVLVHTNPYHAKAFEAFFDRYRIPYSESEFEQHMYGKHNSYIMSYFFNRQIDGDELLALESEKEGLFREIYAEHAEPVAFLPEFLQDLSSHGVALGVATSAPKANMDLVLDTLDLRHYFQSTLSSEDVQAHKPDPEVYLKSADRLGVNPDQCFVFEDSYSGVTAGRAAGMKVIGVLTSHRREDLPPCLDYLSDYKHFNVEKLKELQATYVGYCTCSFTFPMCLVFLFFLHGINRRLEDLHSECRYLRGSFICLTVWGKVFYRDRTHFTVYGRSISGNLLPQGTALVGN